METNTHLNERTTGWIEADPILPRQLEARNQQDRARPEIVRAISLTGVTQRPHKNTHGERYARLDLLRHCQGRRHGTRNTNLRLPPPRLDTGQPSAASQLRTQSRSADTTTKENVPMLSDREILNLHAVTKKCHEVSGVVEFREFVRTEIRGAFPHELAVCCLIEAPHHRLLQLINVDFPSDHLRGLIRHNQQMHGPVTRWLRQQKPLFVEVDDAGDVMDPIWVQSARKHNIQNDASHGLLDASRRFFSYFTFGGIHACVREKYAEYLSFLIPHLHIVLVRELFALRPQIDHRLTQGGEDVQPNSEDVNKASVRYGLTQRETQILTWISIGKTNWEISRIIDVSENTVKNHVQSIYKKLGVKNRTQAAGKAAACAPQVAAPAYFAQSAGLTSPQQPLHRFTTPLDFPRPRRQTRLRRASETQREVVVSVPRLSTPISREAIDK